MHTFKVFGIFSKAEIDVFLEFSCFFDDPLDAGNLISGSSAFSKTSLNIWKFTVDVLLKPGLENFEHYFTGVWDECNCVVVWAFFGIAFLWDWNGSSHRYTYICSLLKLPPISLLIPPLKVDTEPLFEFPEPYSKFLLALCFTYGNVSFHVTLSIHLTLFSPLPMSICLFSVSPLLPWK